MLYYSLLPKRVNRRFSGKRAERYECQFQERGQESFTTDCAFRDMDTGISYVTLVVRFLHIVEEGRVLDNRTQQVVFACQRLADLEPAGERWVREAPAEYLQLVMSGFDPGASLKRQKKVALTLSKLRQLHDELNAQLYAKPSERPTIQSPADAADILMCFIGNLDHEELWVANLDTRNRVMSLVALYKGSVNASQVRVAEVFRQAIVDNAPSILLAHNHPSGDPTPSPDDVAVTRGIVQAGKLLDISVLDHLVLAASHYVSLKERGLGF